MKRIKENAKAIWPSIRSTLKYTTLIPAGCVSICLFPCALYCAITGQNKKCDAVRSNEAIKKRTKKACIADQSRRERALRYRTHSLSIDQGPGLVMNEQAQSPFFTKLPTEIRLQIYREVLGGTERTHLQRWDPQYSQTIPWLSYDCVAAGSFGHNHEQCFSKKTGHRSLCIILTCKRIYREAIETLYSATSFMFDCRTEFLRFTRATPPSCLSHIHEITIQGYIDFFKFSIDEKGLTPRATVQELDKALSSMKGLRRATLIVGPPGSHAHPINGLDYEDGVFVKAECEVWLWLDFENYIRKYWVQFETEPARPTRELIQLK